MRDSQHAHTIIFGMIGERGLWARPQPDTIVVQHKEPVNWAACESVVKHSHTVPVTTPPDGATVSFALIGNPTIAKPQGKGKRGKPTPLPPEKWNTWLERRLGDALTIESIDTERLPVARGRYHARNTTHHRVMFLGTAKVHNHNALHHLQVEGVGRGKAYGCGLLILQEAQ